MKSVKYFIIACLSIAILSYGVIAFANGGTSADSKELSHGDVTGKFVALVEGNSKIKLELENGVETYPLDSSIWIFRDQKKTVLENLKSGDKIELILNSNRKVGYIKAYSEVYLKAELATVSASPTPATPATTVTAEPTPATMVTPEPTPTAAPKENKRIIIDKEDNQVVIEKKEHKNKKHGAEDNDGNDHDRNKHDHDHDHEGEED